MFWPFQETDASNPINAKILKLIAKVTIEKDIKKLKKIGFYITFKRDEFLFVMYVTVAHSKA